MGEMEVFAIVFEYAKTRWGEFGVLVMMIYWVWNMRGEQSRMQAEVDNLRAEREKIKSETESNKIGIEKTTAEAYSIGTEALKSVLKSITEYVHELEGDLKESKEENKQLRAVFEDIQDQLETAYRKIEQLEQENVKLAVEGEKQKTVINNQKEQIQNLNNRIETLIAKYSSSGGHKHGFSGGER